MSEKGMKKSVKRSKSEAEADSSKESVMVEARKSRKDKPKKETATDVKIARKKSAPARSAVRVLTKLRV